MYKEGFNKAYHLVVCKTICERYHDIYDIFGINSTIVTTNQKLIPHYALIVDGDFGSYLIDPLKDLFSNQLGLKTNFFGEISDTKTDIRKRYPNLIDLSFEYVKSIDNKLGLLYEGHYMDYFFQKLHEEMASNKVYEFFNINKNNQYLIMKEKIAYIEKYLINLGNIPGIYERNTLYAFLIFNCFNKREKKYITSDIINDGNNYFIQLNLYPRNLSDEVLTYHEVKENDKYYLKKVI